MSNRGSSGGIGGSGSTSKFSDKPSNTKVTKKIYLKKSPSTEDDGKLNSKHCKTGDNISEEITANVIIFQSLSSLDQEDMYNTDDGRTLSCGGESKKGFFKSKFKTLRKGRLNDNKPKIPVSPTLSVGGSSVTNPSESTSSGSILSVSSGSGGAKPKTIKKSSNFVKKLTNLNKKNKVKNILETSKAPPLLTKSSTLMLTPSPVRHFDVHGRYSLMQHDSDDGGHDTTLKMQKTIQTSKSLSEINILEIDDSITKITTTSNNNNSNNSNNNNNKENKKSIFMVSTSDNENNNIRLPVEPQHNNDHITTIGGHITSNNTMNTNDSSCNMMSRTLSTNVINKVDITPATSQHSIDSNPVNDRHRSIKTLRDEFFETFNLNTTNHNVGCLSDISDFRTVNTCVDRDILKIIETSDFKDETRQLSDDHLEKLKREPEEIIHSEDDTEYQQVNKIEFNIGKSVNRPPKLLYPTKFSDSTDTAILISNNVVNNLLTNSEPQTSLPSLRRKISFKHEDEDDDDEEEEESERRRCKSELSSFNVDSDCEFFSTGEFHEGSLNYLKFLSDYTLDYTEYYKPGCCDIVESNKMSPLPPMPHGDLITSDDMIPPNIMTSQPQASTSSSNSNQVVQYSSGSTAGPSTSASSTSTISKTMAHQGNGGGNNIMSPEKREYLYKILVIGELGTGKTSFIRRYVHNFFSQNYRATIGVDFALKVLNWDQKSIIRLQLWDIAGQERFGNMTRVYYKEAAGAFIVFDVTRSATFDAVVKWKQDLDSKVQLPDGSPIPCILLANKCDQPKQGVANNSSKLDEYVKENGFAGWYETSAKDNINIEDAAKALVNKILQNDKLINSGVLIDNDKIALSSGNGGSSNRDGDSQTKRNCLQC